MCFFFSVDCAVYVCKFMECYALRSPIDIDGITDNSIKKFRADLAYEIVSDKNFGWVESVKNM